MGQGPHAARYSAVNVVERIHQRVSHYQTGMWVKNLRASAFRTDEYTSCIFVCVVTIQ